MLLKLSIQSLKKSIKDYAVYFFTLIIGVTIFYLFNAIKSQSAMMEISESKREIIELMNSTMAGVSVFVAIILGFLIIYASQFLMKRRNNFVPFMKNKCYTTCRDRTLKALLYIIYP